MCLVTWVSDCVSAGWHKKQTWGTWQGCCLIPCMMPLQKHSCAPTLHPSSWSIYSFSSLLGERWRQLGSMGLRPTSGASVGLCWRWDPQGSFRATTLYGFLNGFYLCIFLLSSMAWMQNSTNYRWEVSTRPVSRTVHKSQRQLLSGKEMAHTASSLHWLFALFWCFVFSLTLYFGLQESSTHRGIHNSLYLAVYDLFSIQRRHSTEAVQRPGPGHGERTMQGPLQLITLSYEMSMKQILHFQLDHSQRSIMSFWQRQQLLVAPQSKGGQEHLLCCPAVHSSPPWMPTREAVLSCTHLRWGTLDLEELCCSYQIYVDSLLLFQGNILRGWKKNELT